MTLTLQSTKITRSRRQIETLNMSDLNSHTQHDDDMVIVHAKADDDTDEEYVRVVHDVDPLSWGNEEEWLTVRADGRS